MKTKVLSVVAMFLLGTITLFAQNSVEKFKVFGNCGMCKSRIEKAALSIDGVSKAEWNTENKIIEIAYNETKTSVDKIQKAIANVGHDTKKHKAKDEIYNKLHGCCKYDRAGTGNKKNAHKNHNH